MALEKRSVPIPIGMGLDQGLDEFSLQPPNLLEADDISLEADGAVRKRVGAEPLTPTPDAAGGTLVSSQGSLAVIGPTGLSQYDSELDAWRAAQSSSIYGMTVAAEDVVTNGGVIGCPDMATQVNVDGSPGLVCVVWEDRAAGQAMSAFYDEDGNILYGPAAIGGSINFAPRVVALNGYFLVVGADTDPRSGPVAVYSAIYSVAAGTYLWGTPASKATNCTAYDLYASSGEGFGYLATQSGTSTNVRQIDYLNATLATHSVANAFNPAVYHDSGEAKVALVYNDSVSGDQAYQILAQNLGSVLFSGSLIVSASKPSFFADDRRFIRRYSLSQIAYVCSAPYSAAGVAPGITVIPFSWAGVVGTIGYVQDLCLHSSGHWDADLGLVFSAHNEAGRTRSQPSYTVSGDQPYPAAFLVRENGTPNGEACFLSRWLESPSPGNTFDWTKHLPAMSLGASGVVRLVGTRVVRDEFTGAFTGGAFNDNEIATLRRADFRFGQSELSVADSGGAALVSGGFVGSFDRVSAVENSIHTPPLLWGSSFSTSGVGASHATQAADVRMVGRWVGPDGRIHRSPPSPIAVFYFGAGPTAVGAVTADLQFSPCLSAVNGDNEQDITYELYTTGTYSSTTVGSTPEGGNDYYLCAVIGPTQYTRDTDPSLMIAAAVTFQVDSATIDIGPPLYSNTELTSDPTVAARDVVTTATRAAYLSADGTFVAYSKPLTTATAPEFSDNQRLRVPVSPRKAIALGAIDDKLILFCEDELYVTSLAGGPDATGAGGSFADFRPIPTDSGCTNRKSLATTPVGILFQGRRGIYLVDRSMNVSFVGKAVQEYLSAPVSSATVVPTRSEAHFHYASGGTDYHLVYQYEKQTWYRWSATPGESQTFHQGLLHCLGVDGEVTRETPSLYADGTGAADSYVMPIWSTAWLKLNGIVGFQRVWDVHITGTHTTGNLRIELYYDYDDVAVDTFNFLEPTLNAAAGTPVRIQLRVKPSRQKCESIRIRFVEFISGGEEPIGGGNPTPIVGTAGRGIEIRGIQIDAGVKATSFRGTNYNRGAE